jgi:branched-subunit amino acid ABC-type transport system permease component
MVPFNIIVLGVLTGMVYALLGVGITVTYRTSKAFNMAIGQMGALAAAFVPVLAFKMHLGYAVSIVVALLVAGLTGVFTEVLVVRKLANASRLIVLVATIGLSQVFFTAEVFLPNKGLGSRLFPVPFHAVVDVGTLRLSSGYLLMLIVVPVVVGLTAMFFQRTTIGLASRAAAENQDAARLVGIPVRRVSLVVWTLSGLLAGIAAILIGPTQPIGTTPQLIGPTLLLRALTAALIGGLASLPQVVAGGVLVGVVEAVLLYKFPSGGTVDIAMLAIIVVSLIVRPEFRHAVRSAGGSAWSLTGGPCTRLRSPSRSCCPSP